jgi:adenine-specific DNA methylase
VIPSTCKRLIEVDFPIAAVSAHSAKEKSIRHGHPSTLHLWWARRPLAACRAVLLGLLLPDPCDKDCPIEFRKKARELLAKRFNSTPKSDADLRELLLKFIGEFADWDNASTALYLEIGRGLVKAVNPDESPVVVDPFSGGGSIPLEALRLGCEAFASDLNPVACLILKTLLEDIPRYGNAEIKLPDKNGKEVIVHGLAEALRHVGKQVKEAVEKELAKFYPPDPDGSRPIAYLWARTVRCEGIGCGAEIPLVRSFWLCQKPVRKRALRYHVEKPKGKTPEVVFEIFSPKSEQEIPAGTVSRANATCPCCHIVLPAERVRVQLTSQNGGAEPQFDAKGRRNGGAMLLAVVTLSDGGGGRSYRLPTPRDYDAVITAQKAASKLSPHVTPKEPLPLMSGTFNVPLYGMNTWGSLFIQRQLLYLTTLLQVAQKHCRDNPVLQVVVAQTISHVLDRNTALCRWRPESYMETVESMYGRQALPMVWDFAEAVPLSDSTGSFEHALKVVSQCLETSAGKWGNKGHVELADARESPLVTSTANVWFTDPPYYFAVPYADLSDFFFVWLKRALPQHSLLRDPFDPTNPLTPKKRELCEMAHWDEKRYAEKDKKFFEDGVAVAFAEGRRILRSDGVGCVVFAHKTTEAWEALLAGLLRAGLTVTASWPITTEMNNRLRARNSAALAGSVHLVCRPRPEDAGIGDWSEVKAAMEKRIREWLPTLRKHGVRGADAIFSCLGPALESYSRYDKVLTAGDRVVPLGGDPDASEPHERGFLAYVFEALSKEALRQVLGDADTEGFEEDARLTALFLWTLQATKANGNGKPKPEVVEDEEESEDDDEAKPKKAKAGYSMPFDTFIRLTRPMGIHYPTLEGRVIEIEKGVVRLLPVRERGEQLLGEAATRPGIEISLEDVKQMELGLATPRQQESALPTKSKRGQKSEPAPGKPAEEATFTTLDRIHAALPGRQGSHGEIARVQDAQGRPPCGAPATRGGKTAVQRTIRQSRDTSTAITPSARSPLSSFSATASPTSFSTASRIGRAPSFG